MADQLPRELMESALAQASEETFKGFSESRQADIFNGPHRRLFEVVYRMGFECGWRIREGMPDGVPVNPQRVNDGGSSDGR